MSLVRPDFWNPSVPDFSLALLDRQNELYWTPWGASAKPMDYVFSTLIGVFFLGLQGCLLLSLMQSSQKCSRHSNEGTPALKGPKYRIRNRSPFLCFPTTLSLAPLFVIAMTLQCVNFGIRIWSLGMVKDASEELANNVSTVVCRVTVCLETTPYFNRVVRALEMSASLLFQIMILVADYLLVIRCIVVFSDKRWVPFLVGGAYLLSVASAIIGLVAIPHNFPISSDAQVVYGYGGAQREMTPAGYISSILSTSSSVLVNVIATTAIVARILLSRRRALTLESQITKDLEKLTPQGSPRFPSRRLPECEPPSYSKTPAPRYEAQNQNKRCDRFVTVSAILVETALPSAILGLFACLTHPMLTSNARILRPLLDARFSIRILWAASTVMAPQMIMLQVLLRRDSHTRSKVAEDVEDLLQFANVQVAPGGDTFAFHQTRRRSRSVDSLSLSPSLASITDAGSSVLMRLSKQEEAPDDWGERNATRPEGRTITKAERAQLST